MKALTYYLTQSARGDKHAAYEAAKIMHLEKHSEVMVQAQLRKAASMGSVDAMRWLGFLGLSGHLITPDSTVSKVSYYSTYAQAYHWFEEGLKRGDSLSAFAAATCLHSGIGTKPDKQKSEAIMQSLSEEISVDVIVPILYLLNALHPFDEGGVSAGIPFIDSILMNCGDASGEARSNEP